MIDVDDDHLGGAARGAARFDGAGGTVADLEEAHQARRLAAARQLLVLAAQRGEIGAGAGAVFEQARLAGPQVHDTAIVDEIVGDGLDEAGMRLRVLIGAGGFGEPAGLEVHVVVALAGAVDAIGPVQAGVEPLRRVGRGLLGREHIGEFVLEGAGVILRVEIAALPAPIGPGAGEPVEHILGGVLAARLGAVGGLAPEEFGDALLGNGLQRGGDAGLAEICLRQHIAGDLRPLLGDFDVGLLEDDRAVRVADLADGVAERDAFVRRMTLDRVLTANTPMDLIPECSLLASSAAACAPFQGQFSHRRVRACVAGTSAVALLRPPDLVSRSATGPKYGHHPKAIASEKW